MIRKLEIMGINNKLYNTFKLVKMINLVKMYLEVSIRDKMTKSVFRNLQKF